MRIEKTAETVFTPLADGTGVLLDVGSLLYFSLNRTGVALWQQIEERQSLSFDDLVRATLERFDVEDAEARRYLGAFIADLQKYNIVRAE